MKTVYLIRHGLPDFPGGRRMCIGTTDIPLGETGLAQAAETARQLPSVTAVFSSPLTRAVQTAEAISGNITILEDLREMHAGAWDGLTFDQIREQYPDLYAARAFDNALPLPDAEPEEAALSRFRTAMHHAAASAPGDLAVVAHGGIISLFLESLGAGRYKPGYAEVIVLQFDNNIFTLQEESLCATC